jgi:hypothetical protein
MTRQTEAQKAEELQNEICNILSIYGVEKIYDAETEILHHVEKYIRTAQSNANAPEVVTHEQMIEKFNPSPVFKSAFHEIVEWINVNYPNGIKIIDGEK